MDVDPHSAELIEDKTFITKILGEMKNQFNNKLDIATESDVINSDAQLSDDELDVDVKQEDVIAEIDKIEPENETDMSGNNTKAIDDVKFEADDSNGDADDQPRIVMCFRKPSSISKKQRINRRSKRNKVHNVVHLKRSTRRRSKDCGESVLQSAIARKEKSYNETSKPQRLTRQLKPTQKILDNIANAAALKQDRRKDKAKPHKNNDKTKELNYTNSEDLAGSVGHASNEKNKNQNTSKMLRNNKRLKTNHTKSGKELDAEVKCRSNNTASEETEELEKDEDAEEIVEKNVKMLKPVDKDGCSVPEDVTASAQLIASRLCVCSNQTNLYVYSNVNEEVHCTAIDSIGDKLIGCNNIVNGEEVSMIRPSPRVPYNILCKLHRNRMLRHNCCPTCGIFCTQGRFSQCKNKHQYHRDCQISVGEIECCPHCGISTPLFDVVINMVTSKPPLFTPTQKSQHPNQKLNIQDCKIFNNEERECPSPPIISLEDLKLTNTAVKSKESSQYEVQDLLKSIQVGNYQDVTTILGSRSVNLKTFVSCDDCASGTVLHYSAKKGLLPVIHMLKIADMDLDILDSEQYTALMLAVLGFQNDTVKYLTRAGANVTTKGIDGMTALHLSAKSGNLEATEILLSAAVHIKGYIDFVDDGGWSPLVWACEHGHVDIVKYLLSEGADPVLMDVEQNAALHWAAFSGSSKIVEMILNFGGEVNKLNSHGDSPLHIAARQDNYNCVLILLARGAKINVNNKMGESPVDCCPESCKSREALSLNLHLQSLITVDDKSHTFLSHDISGGKEQNPIQCINEVDDTKNPSDFVYITVNCITSNIVVDWKITSLKSCTCGDKCNSGSCNCGFLSFQSGYEHGRLSRQVNYEDPPIIFECNQVCTCCAITCKNRVVQKGSHQKLQLFRTENKGWGIRSTKKISSGSYVSEYIGELITDTEADNRDDDTYLFDLDNRDEDTYCIDAKYYGNFSRFINHSCNPNLIPVRVFIDHHDLKFPRIALFASRDINVSEELSFDYGDKFWVIKYKFFTCKCDSSNCKYSNKTISTT